MTRKVLSQADCDRLRDLCATGSMRAAAAVVGCQPNTVRDVRDRGWKAGTGQKPLRARPSDFKRRAKTMSHQQLAKHYRACGRLIARWADEVGIPHRKPTKTCPALPVPDGSKEAMSLYGAYGTTTALERLLRDHGINRAAEIYGVSYGTISRWRKRFGLPFSWSRQPGAKRDLSRPVPTLPRRVPKADRQLRAARAAIADFTTRQHERARREREQAY